MSITAGNYVAPLRSGDTVQPVEGLDYGFIEERVVLTRPVANVTLPRTLPPWSVVLAAEIKLVTTITATTATKVGLGRITSTADPDKYALTGALTVGTSRGSIITNVAVSAGGANVEQIGIFACDNSGAAAGTINAGRIIVRLWFLVTEAGW